MDSLRERFIETAGYSAQSLCTGRVIGQIFAHTYLAREPQSLDDLKEKLGISKGSASQSVRQLEQWGALRKIWIKGERRDYYEVCDDFGKIVRKAVLDHVARRMETVDLFLEQAETILADENRGEKRDQTDFNFVKSA